MVRGWLITLGLCAALTLNGAAPLGAQVRQIDPNTAIDSDIGGARRQAPDNSAPGAPYAANQADSNGTQQYQQSPPQSGASADSARTADNTYSRQDLIGAGEGVFGKGAQGLAEILEKILREQGRPNAYIAGREASGAFVLGARYGSGLMSHKVEGNLPVYWTGPSIGFDAGGNASKVFVLVYNLYDTEDLFRRYPEGEGHLYFVGGFSATYLRRGNIVLIPVRLGVGLRAGVNVGYMKFSKKAKWLPL